MLLINEITDAIKNGDVFICADIYELLIKRFGYHHTIAVKIIIEQSGISQQTFDEMIKQTEEVK